MQDLLDAYHNRDANKITKKRQDMFFTTRQREYIKMLEGPMYFQKQGFGLLQFTIKDVRRKFQLQMGFKGGWVVVPCDKTNKCYAAFKQPYVEKNDEVLYTDMNLPLSGLPACIPYSRMACNKIEYLFYQLLCLRR